MRPFPLPIKRSFPKHPSIHKDNNITTSRNDSSAGHLSNRIQSGSTTTKTRGVDFDSDFTPLFVMVGVLLAQRKCLINRLLLSLFTELLPEILHSYL